MILTGSIHFQSIHGDVSVIFDKRSVAPQTFTMSSMVLVELSTASR